MASIYQDQRRDGVISSAASRRQVRSAPGFFRARTDRDDRVRPLQSGVLAFRGGSLDPNAIATTVSLGSLPTRSFNTSDAGFSGTVSAPSGLTSTTSPVSTDVRQPSLEQWS